MMFAMNSLCCEYLRVFYMFGLALDDTHMSAELK